MSNSMHQLSFEDLDSPSPLSLLTPDEIYQQADEEMLRKLVEDNRFEKKANRFSQRELGDYMSMWANTRPHGGIMAIGIRNDKEFEGMDAIGLAAVSEIEAAPGRYCPDAQFETKRVPIHRDSDGELDFVILIRVFYHPSRVVRNSSQQAFIRLGDTKKRLSEEEIRQLQAEKGEIRFETEPSRLSYPNQFDASAISAFVEDVKGSRGLQSYHSNEEILEIMHLGSINEGVFTPNIACDLLFAKDPVLSVPGCRIRFLRFDGEVEGTGEKWNAVKDEYVEGPIPSLIIKAATLLKSQLRSFSRLDKNGTFVTSPEYPDAAWYEAIVNACAHRSYGNGLGNAAICIRMFDDRLQIESPGPFPPFVDPENIQNSGSNPTNPFLMEALRHLNFVKAAREGTRRMLETMAEMGLPSPEFSQETESGSRWVYVVLRNNIKQRKVWVDKDVANLIGAHFADLMSSDQKKVLNYIAEYGQITVSQASRLIEARTWHSAKKLLLELVEMGILEHIHRSDIERDPKAHFILKRPRNLKLE